MRKEQRKQVFWTFRLTQDDKELLRDIGRTKTTEKNRYVALLEVGKYVEKVPPPVQPEKRDPIRIGIPAEVAALINKHKKKTKKSFTNILLDACRLYREEHPFEDEAPPE